MKQRAFKLCLAILIILLATSCHKRINPVYKNMIGKVKTVLVLGNSITIHPPKASIGWNHNWGMAASTQDSDFVHLLTATVHSKDASAIVQFRNIVDFEKDYLTYDPSVLDSIRNPDVLVLRIGDNVDDKHIDESVFIAKYGALIHYIHPKIVIVTTAFWKRRHVNRYIENYAVAHNVPFIELSHLSSDESNLAGKKYAYKPIQRHPCDKGMRMIKDEIWNYMKIYF